MWYANNIYSSYICISITCLLYCCCTLAPSWWSAQHYCVVAYHIVGEVHCIHFIYSTSLHYQSESLTVRLYCSKYYQSALKLNSWLDCLIVSYYQSTWKHDSWLDCIVVTYYQSALRLVSWFDCIVVIWLLHAANVRTYAAHWRVFIYTPS